MLAHRTKRVKVEAARRARSTPRPSLLNEDAVLVTDRAAAPAPGTTFSQYTWQVPTLTYLVCMWILAQY